MDFFDFITEDELADLPEDPQAAFVQFFRLAEPRLMAKLTEVRTDDYTLTTDIKHSFQNVMLAAAKQFRIKPFMNQSVPEVYDRNENRSSSYDQFRADLTHYIAQLMIALSVRERGDSLVLPTKSLDSIRSYIYHLREAIEKSDLPDSKKKAMQRRLDALEEELGRKRVRYFVIARVVIEILAIPGALQQSYDAMANLTTKIMREIGEVKLAQDDERHIPPTEPVALLPPRPKLPKRPKSADMDDEIPF